VVEFLPAKPGAANCEAQDSLATNNDLSQFSLEYRVGQQTRLHCMRMSTPNKKGKGRALSTMRPLVAPNSNVSSSYSNSVAHAPQHNGDNLNYGAPIYTFNINSAYHRLGLDSSVTPSSPIPQSLPDARIQIQAIDNPQPTRSPNSGIRPGTSSRRSAKRKNRFRRVFQLVLFFFIFAILLSFTCATIMLIFNARESSL
jgi:hypothetical protein